MKKQMGIVVIGLISVFLLFGSSFAWQGRMAGMGDPYGLVQDESDMLIHPAMIMNSSGTRFYTHYRFTYTDVMDWDYEWDLGAFGFTDFFQASGDEYRHEALIGSAFNVGTGRMGIFLTYENQSGDYDGKVDSIRYPGDLDFDLESDKSDFAFSFLFGFPIDCTAIGFEAGLAYHNEENKVSQEWAGLNATNPIYNMTIFPTFWGNTSPYMIPYDSEYMETFLKASAASELGCNADFGLTLNGGYIFFGDNELYYKDDLYIPAFDVEMDGDVEGWSIGGDFWFRYKIDDSFSLPFLVSASYQEKVRDGDDDNNILGDFDYEHKEVTLNIEAGGGLDIALNDTSKIASGIYYQYTENNNDFSLDMFSMSSWTDMDRIPDYDEHRITLKLAFEKDMSSTVGFRAGLNCFYGWADWDYKNDWMSGAIKESVSMDGDLWGIGLTLGGTIKIDPMTIEPFIGFAYQETNLDGDGDLLGVIDIEGDHERNQWLVTTGLSILF
ncbi:MAG: autotransporter outer membrane beta-barrel domain-containing protein [Deltaproteobacteria bacterium]|nr:autotransporter outer membrane beta-barrel domain-containing protein [Deltaproteobacteria bacterium]